VETLEEEVDVRWVTIVIVRSLPVVSSKTMKRNFAAYQFWVAIGQAGSGERRAPLLRTLEIHPAARRARPILGCSYFMIRLPASEGSGRCDRAE
jgi:hypothetical protein